MPPKTRAAAAAANQPSPASASTGPRRMTRSSQEASQARGEAVRRAAARRAATRRPAGQEPVAEEPVDRASALPAPQVKTEEIILGIDMGSSGVRASMRPKDCAPTHPKMIYNKKNYRESYTFPANIYPFGNHDDSDLYDGEKDHEDRDGVAMKYAMYILADASADLVKEYPLIDRLRDEDLRDRENFRQKLRLGIISMLRFIKVKCDETIETMNRAAQCVVDRLCVTIPAQWNLDFEEVYLQLIAEAFNWTLASARDRVRFFYEAEALVYYLLFSPAYEAEQLAKNEDVMHQLCLFMDFGGHNMNGSLYWVTRRVGKPPKFFAMGATFGAGGGGEHFIDSLVKACAQKLRDGGLNMTLEQRKHIIRTIKHDRADLGPHGDKREFTVDVKTGPGTCFTCQLTRKEVIDCWNEAYRRTFLLARDKIKALVSLYNREGLEVKPLVILAGGSLRNESLCIKLKEEVKRAGLGAPQLVNQHGGDADSARNAMGAIYTTWVLLTVQGFFEQGAGIGLQIQQAGQKRKVPLWDRVYHPILFYDTKTNCMRSRALTVDVIAGDHLRLVCDPFLGQDFEFGGWNKAVPKPAYKRTYNLLEDLPVPTSNGKFECQIDFRNLQLDQGGMMCLKLKIIPEKLEGQDANPLIRKQWVIPVYFDAGSRCFLLGERGKTLKEAAPEIFKDDDGDIEMTG